MKEVLYKTRTGDNMVKRFSLTQNGINVNSFQKVNTVEDNTDLRKEENDAIEKADYPYECAVIVSEQTGWLDEPITVYNRIALYKPKIEILNAFSELSKILIMANGNIVKTFNIGGLTGSIDLDFLENDELIGDSENPEDPSQYFKNSGFKAVNIDGCVSPIILNPYSINNPTTVTINLVGNTDPAASGIFRVSIRTDID